MQELFDLSGKVAMVTGATRGVGEGTAKALGVNRTTLYKKMKRLGLEDEAAKMGL